MPYDTNKLALIGGGGGMTPHELYFETPDDRTTNKHRRAIVAQVWVNSSDDAAGTVDTLNYVSDGIERGLAEGDIFINVSPTNGVSFHVVNDVDFDDNEVDLSDALNVVTAAAPTDAD